MFGFTVKKKVETPAEQKLEEIKNILFPPSETKEVPDKESGEMLKYQVDYTIDMNLDSALYDIREGYADAPVQNTIQDAIDRLIKIRKILEADMELDPEANYIIVDNKYQEHDIQASEDNS